MYLSQLNFNLRDQSARRNLRTPYTAHATILRGFPFFPSVIGKAFEALPKEERKAVEELRREKRVLFRVEPQRRDSLGVQVLVQSIDEPDWWPLIAEGHECHSKLVPDLFAVGRRLRFRLRANPVVSRDGDPEQRIRGRRFRLNDESAQIEWLEKRARENGFQVNGADVLVTDEGFQKFRKAEGRHEICLQTVLFDGRLVVTDPVIFQGALRAGLGPAKGLGCGLLTVANG